MNRTPALLLAGVCALLAAAGCQTRRTPDPQADAVPIDLDGVEGRLAGPFTHNNLTVFLIDSPRQDGRDFLTLDEGLADGRVAVFEEEGGRVEELRIDNRSDRPLYLQEGERLSGGKQDRTIAGSMVVPAHSGWTAVTAFCIEPHRWAEAGRGEEFARSLDDSLAPKGVRGEAKYARSQQGVWRGVARFKANAMTTFAARSVTSSLNEALDDPAVRGVVEEYAAALAGAAADDPDAVGVAVAVNGELEEADVYPNHAVFLKMYPRLIRSYAAQAELLKDLKGAAGAPTAEDVAGLLRGGAEHSRKDRKVDSRNTLEIAELEGGRFRCVSSYQGAVVHWQMMKKNGTPAEQGRAGEGRGDDKQNPRQARTGTDW
jgi:hypothetical protein